MDFETIKNWASSILITLIIIGAVVGMGYGILRGLGFIGNDNKKFIDKSLDDMNK